MSGNSLQYLILYRVGKTGWAFDDDNRGISAEPFVCGIPEIINDLVRREKITGREIRILYSGREFPGHQIVLDHISGESGGNWYQYEGMKGWLCPTLYRYFPYAPKRIYVRVERL